MNPYQSLPPKAFWRSAVAERNMFDIDELWEPRFDLRPDASIVTFGSCFAQHIGRALSHRGLHWSNLEPAPPGLSAQDAEAFHYGEFSARTGNLYTASLLKQWTGWALGHAAVPGEAWTHEGRVHDPFRPAIEPGGFECAEEMRQSREQTLRSLRACIAQAGTFVFTLGLTECWRHREGHEYPLCPGTLAGRFEPGEHVFVRLRFAQVLQDLAQCIEWMRALNPGLKFLLTVSPVPLTATASGGHVLVATMESKSILRAVAGQMATDDPLVDYFPSYELINSPVFRGSFFEANQRTVGARGVAFVMDGFFGALERRFGAFGDAAQAAAPPNAGPCAAPSGDAHCEEALLDAFGPRR